MRKASHCGSKQQQRSPDKIIVTIKKYNQLFTRFTSIVRGHSPRSLQRDHSIIACSRHTYMGAVLRAYPVHSEPHIQRNANGEVAATSPPFRNEPHLSHVLFVKAAPGTTFTSWSQHHFVVSLALQTRPVTSLWHQEGRRVFWEGPKCFGLCPIIWNYVQHIFPRGEKFFLGGFAPPGFGTAANT